MFEGGRRRLASAIYEADQAEVAMAFGKGCEVSFASRRGKARDPGGNARGIAGFGAERVDQPLSIRLGA